MQRTTVSLLRLQLLNQPTLLLLWLCRWSGCSRS